MSNLSDLIDLDSYSDLIDLESYEYWEFADTIDSRFLLLDNNQTNNTSVPDNITEEDALEYLNKTSIPTDSAKLRQTFYAYGTTLAVTFFAFCWARRQFPLVFNVRRRAHREESSLLFHQKTRDDVDENIKTHLANNTYGFFSWSWKLFTIPETMMMDECGMDALCFLRICSMGYRFALCGIINSVWLLPVYATAEDELVVPGINETIIEALNESMAEKIEDRIVQLTTANVASGDRRLVATALATYVLFGQIMYVINQEFKWFIKMRHRFMSKRKPRNYAIYVRNIPETWRSNHGLQAFFERSIGGVKVQQSHISVKADGLKKKIEEREEILTNLEHAVAEADESGKRPTHVPEQGLVSNVLDKVPVKALINHSDNKVDSIRYYKEALLAMNREITMQIQKLQDCATQRDVTGSHFEDEEDDFSSEDESESVSGYNESNSSLPNLLVNHVDNVARNFFEDQKRVSKEAAGVVLGTANVARKLIPGLSGDDGQVLSAGFVTFSTMSTTQAALQMIHHEKPYTMEALEAPDPEDIFWFNVGREHRDLKFGELVSLAFTIATCLFWTVPVTFVASLANIGSLRKEVPALDSLLEAAPFMEPVLEVLAPQLLVALNAMLPVILLWVTNFQGSVSASLNQASLFTKLAFFTIIQTFFVSSISGGVLREIQRLILRPGALMDLLAESLPVQSTFFIQLIFISTTTSFFSESLSPVRVGKGVLRSFLGPRLTSRERKSTYNFLRPLSDPRECEHPLNMANLILIFMVYMVYSVIAPLVCYVAALCFVVIQVLYRHQFVYLYPPRPDSGGRLWLNFISILINCMMVAEVTIIGLLTLKKSWASSFMVPLLVATVMFYFYLHDKHFTVADNLPTRICLSRDRRNEGKDLTFMQDAYLQPEMKEPKAIPQVSEERLRELGFESSTSNPSQESNSEEKTESVEDNKRVAFSDTKDDDNNETRSESTSTDAAREGKQEESGYTTVVLPSNGATCRVKRLQLPSNDYVAQLNEWQSLIEEGDEEEEIDANSEIQA